MICEPETIQIHASKKLRSSAPWRSIPVNSRLTTVIKPLVVARPADLTDQISQNLCLERARADPNSCGSLSYPTVVRLKKFDDSSTFR